jgi:amino-acid N-acetyltransferase
LALTELGKRYAVGPPGDGDRLRFDTGAANVHTGQKTTTPGRREQDLRAPDTPRRGSTRLPPTIAAATPADLPAIFQLLDDNRLPRAGLDAHLTTTLVARDDGAIVGTAALELYGAAALLRSVAVSSAQRGWGLGRALTTAALDVGRRRGVSIVYLLTETAGAFFPKLGFRPIARADVDPAVLGSTEFTTACPQSALVMARSLH